MLQFDNISYIIFSPPTLKFVVNFIGEDGIKIPGVNPTFWLNHIFFTNPMQFDASVSFAILKLYHENIHNIIM